MAAEARGATGANRSQRVEGSGWRRGWDTAWNLLFPPACAACGVEVDAGARNVRLCGVCRTLFVSRRDTVCSRCGAIAEPALVGADGCPGCRSRRLRFRGVLSLGTYDGPLRQAVLRMKRPAGETLAAAVANLLCDCVEDRLSGLEFDVAVPIPMHWMRRLVRGTNSAEIIAEVVGRRLRLPVARRLLVRRRKTKPQFSLHPEERFRNIRGAFRVAAGYYLNAARVLLVDDILTTGATCSDAARTLLAAGAAQVSVLVVARTEDG